MSSRRQGLSARVNWYLQSSLKHITELITGNESLYRGGRFRQVPLYKMKDNHSIYWFFGDLGAILTLQWRHNECNGVSCHRRFVCLLKRLFRRRSIKVSKLHVTGLYEGISPETAANSPHKGSVTRKMLSFDDVIMKNAILNIVLLIGIIRSHDNALRWMTRDLLMMSQHWFI